MADDEIKERIKSDGQGKRENGEKKAS